MTAQCPDSIPAGDLSAEDVRRRCADKSRLGDLLERTKTEALDDDNDDNLAVDVARDQNTSDE